MKHWTETEDAQLRELYPDASMEELVEKLNRSKDAITSRAYCLKVKRSEKYMQESRTNARKKINFKPYKWNDEKVALLCELYNKMSPQAVAKEMGLSIHCVTKQASRFGISNSVPKWDSDQDDFLKQVYPNTKISLERIASQLDRSVPAIVSRAHKLSLKRRKNLKNG